MHHHFRSSSAALAILALALTGCASGAAADGSSSITVGTSPTISNASLYAAIEDGSFTAAGLDITPQVVQAGAQSIPLLLNGQVQFAASDPVSALVALSQGVPIRIVAVGNVVAPDAGSDSTAIVTKPGTAGSATELQGRTVAVNAMNSIAHLGARAAIDAAGGDSSAVDWVELSFPQMVDSVVGGTVDGAAVAEPFVTQAESAELAVVPNSGLSAALAGVPQLVYMTTATFAESNPELISSFAATIDAANVRLGADPDAVRTTAAASTSLPAEVLSVMRMPTFGPGLTLDRMQFLESVMVTYGALEGPIPSLVDAIVVGDGR